MKTLTLGYSICPNDTFIFYAMVHGRVDTKNLHFKEVLLDVEALNQKALSNELDLTKVSYHAFGHLRKNYCLLRAGGALGRGCGPLLVANKECSMDELKDKRIAIPGKLTTAYLLLQLFAPELKDVVSMPFNQIMDAVKNNEVAAGLVIHEGRFTYHSYGLIKIIDLGEWWEKETGLPLPLGGIVARRSLGEALNKKINKIVRKSVEYALSHRDEPLNYIKQHSQELSDEVLSQHIALYVNDYSIDIGEDGEKAVRELLLRAEEAGVIPKAKGEIF